MSVLFVDTSYDITLGLLTEAFKWCDLRHFHGQKASNVIQNEAHRLLTEHNLKLRNITSIVTVAGPGFYTGLRLSEGFADVVKFFGIPHYSFYSHEIPLWLGITEGTWATKAYRGEYFFYNWDKQGSRITLVTEKDLPSTTLSSNVFIHSETALDEKLRGVLNAPISTLQLLKDHPEKIICAIVSQKLSRESFYFRAPEDEFRTST